MSTVADKIEINELIARYNVAIDTGDAEAWARTFAPDGVCDDLPRRVDGEWLFARRRVRAHEDPDACRERAGAGQTRQGPT